MVLLSIGVMVEHNNNNNDKNEDADDGNDDRCCINRNVNQANEDDGGKRNHSDNDPHTQNHTDAISRYIGGWVYM